MNRKRIRRVYRLEGLQLRMRIRRRKHMCLHRGPVPAPGAPNERWSMDSYTTNCAMPGRSVS